MEVLGVAAASAGSTTSKIEEFVRDLFITTVLGGTKPLGISTICYYKSIRMT